MGEWALSCKDGPSAYVSFCLSPLSLFPFLGCYEQSFDSFRAEIHRCSDSAIQGQRITKRLFFGKLKFSLAPSLIV